MNENVKIIQIKCSSGGRDKFSKTYDHRSWRVCVFHVIPSNREQINPDNIEFLHDCK